MAIVTYTKTVESKDTVDGVPFTTQEQIDTNDWSNIINTPTTLAGYGITDAYTKAESDANYSVKGTFDRATSVLTNGSVFSDIVVVDGLVTAISTRNIHTDTDLGELNDVNITSVTDAEIIAYDSGPQEWINRTLAEAGIAATNHTHSAYDYDSQATLSGATVFSNINVINGIVTGNIITRNLTASDIGAEPADSDITKANETETISGGWTWSSQFIRLNNNIELYFGTATSESYIYSDGNHTYWNLVNGNLLIQDSGTSDFRFMGDGSGDFDADGDITARSDALSSDRRLKKNIKSIESEDALHLLQQLEGVEFEWIDKEKGYQAGFIAQDFEKHLPNLVKEKDSIKDGREYKSIKYSQVIPYLTEAIKHMAERIQYLESNQ